MASYEFRTAHIPGVVVRDDRSSTTQYEIGDNRMGAAQWGGVMEATIAAALRPWARPVTLIFDSYRVGAFGWEDLNKDERIWGCLLIGPQSGQHVVFAVLKNGMPAIAKKSVKAKLA